MNAQYMKQKMGDGPMPWLKQLVTSFSLERPRFNPRLGHVGLGALLQVFILIE